MFGGNVVRMVPNVMSAGAQLLIGHILSLKMESETLYQVHFLIAASVGVMSGLKIQLIASVTECNASISSRKITCFILPVYLLLTISKLRV